MTKNEFNEWHQGEKQKHTTVRLTLASLPLLNILFLYSWGYHCSLRSEKHRENVVRQEVTFVPDILRWNFQRELGCLV